MVKKEVKVVWSKSASKHFLNILEYLSLQSQQATIIIGEAILNEIERIAKSPLTNPEDRFKKGNDGSYRAGIVYSYRISYRINKATVQILRIRHTSREPLEF